jgi:hypothetical protein
VPRGWRRVAIPAFSKLPLAARRSILHALGKYAPWESGFDLTPPPTTTNEVTGPPDFVGIGVQKAGTSWWYTIVCAHPRVYTRQDIHKERHFFDRYAARTFGPTETSLYHGWFPRPPGSVTGEWTPDYLDLPWVPALLARAAPQARLLVLLRDPVERFRSGLAHIRRADGKLSVESLHHAVARGFYHDTLCRWLDYFSPEQLLVLQYERCVADPVGQLSRTYRFLGLEPFVPVGIGERVNQTERAFEIDEDACRRLVELYTSDVLALSTRFEDVDLALWPNFAALASG